MRRGRLFFAALAAHFSLGHASPVGQAQTTPIVPGALPSAPATAQADPLHLTIGLEGQSKGGDVSVAVQIVILMTLLTLAPSIVLLMTSFTRIVIVLGFVRTALGVPSAPSNQIIVGLSIFLTFFIMGPVFDRMNGEAIQPYMAGKMTSVEALDRASVPLKEFMLKQTRARDLEYVLELGEGSLDARRGPRFCGERTPNFVPNGLFTFSALPRHRFSGVIGAHGARHDDDAPRGRRVAL